MQETWVQYLGQEDPLEKEMATIHYRLQLYREHTVKYILLFQDSYICKSLDIYIMYFYQGYNCPDVNFENRSKSSCLYQSALLKDQVV